MSSWTKTDAAGGAPLLHHCFEEPRFKKFATQANKVLGYTHQFFMDNIEAE